MRQKTADIIFHTFSGSRNFNQPYTIYRNSLSITIIACPLNYPRIMDIFRSRGVNSSLSCLALVLEFASMRNLLLLVNLDLGDSLSPVKYYCYDDYYPYCYSFYCPKL